MVLTIEEGLEQYKSQALLFAKMHEGYEDAWPSEVLAIEQDHAVVVKYYPECEEVSVYRAFPTKYESISP